MKLSRILTGKFSSKLSARRRRRRRLAHLELLESRVLLTTFQNEVLHLENDEIQPIFGDNHIVVGGNVGENDVDTYSFFAVEGQQISASIDPALPSATISMSARRSAEVSFFDSNDQFFNSYTIGVEGIDQLSSDEATPAKPIERSDSRGLFDSTFSTTVTWPVEKDNKSIVIKEKTNDVTELSEPVAGFRSVITEETDIRVGEFFANYGMSSSTSRQDEFMRFELYEYRPVIELRGPAGNLLATDEGYTDFYETQSLAIGHTAEVAGIYTITLKNKTGEGSYPYDLNVRRSTEDMQVEIFANTQTFLTTPSIIPSGINISWTDEQRSVALQTDASSQIFLDGVKIGDAFGIRGITINGGQLGDTIDASQFDPSLLPFPDSFQLSINSGGGEDLIRVPEVRSAINGGDGEDTFVMAIVGNARANDSEIVWGEVGEETTNTIESIEIIEIHGDDNGNTLDADTSSAVQARLFGYGGNDYLFGGDGNDLLSGGTGNDNLNGGLGADELLGGPDHDALRANGTAFVVGDGAMDKADGGEGWDRIHWGPGDAFALLTGGVDADNDDIDTLRFVGNADELDIVGSRPAGTPPQLAIDRDGNTATAVGFEKMQVDLYDFSRPQNQAAPQQTVNIIEPYGVADLSVRTDSSKDVITIEAAAFTSGEASVDVFAGDGADEVSLIATQTVGDELELNVEGEDGDDTLRLVAVPDGHHPINVDFSGGVGTDTIIIDGTDQADRIFITQLEDLVNGIDIAPGQYTPDMEEDAEESRKDRAKVLVHVNNSLVEIDMERELPGTFFREEGSERLIINGGTGRDTVGGTLDQFVLTNFGTQAQHVLPPKDGLERITVNGGDEVDTGGSSLPGDTIDLSGISLLAVPADTGAPPLPTVRINGDAGDDELAGRGEADFIDGGPGTDGCSTVEAHVNCEADVTVTAVYDNHSALNAFGGYIPGVDLANTFTVTIPEPIPLPAETVVQYRIDVDATDTDVVAEATRISPDQNVWEFGFDMGRLAATGSDSKPRRMDISMNGTELFPNGLDLFVKNSLPMDLRVKPLGAGLMEQPVGPWIDFENLRLIDGMDTSGGMHFQLRTTLPTFPDAGAASPDPYSDKLQLVRRHYTAAREREVFFKDLSFSSSSSGSNTHEAEFQLNNGFVAQNINGASRDADFAVFLADRDFLDGISDVQKNLTVHNTPDWLGTATDVTRTFVTTKDVLPDAGELTADQRLWQAFGNAPEDQLSASDHQHFGGYVIEANLGIATELTSSLTDAFPFSDTRVFEELMDLFPELSVKLQPRVTAYAKLDISEDKVADLHADHFDVRVVLVDRQDPDNVDKQIELVDKTYDFGNIDITAKLDPISLDLVGRKLTITTDVIQLDELMKSIEQTPDESSSKIPVPLPIPWMTATLAGGYRLGLDKAAYQVSVGIELEDDRLKLVQQDTWVDFSAESTAAAIGQIDVGIGAFGIKLLGFTGTATVQAGIGGNVKIHFGEETNENGERELAFKFNEDDSEWKVNWDWSFDAEVTNIVDSLNKTIENVEEQINQGIQNLQDTLDDLEDSLDVAKNLDDDDAKKTLSEQWLLFEEKLPLPDDESDDNEPTGNATKPSFFGSIQPQKGSTLNLLGPGMPNEGEVGGLNLAGELSDQTLGTSFQLNVTADEQTLNPNLHRLQVVAVDTVNDAEEILREIDLSEIELAAGDVPNGFLSGWSTIDVPVAAFSGSRKLQFRLLSDGTQQVAVALDDVQVQTTVPMAAVAATAGTLGESGLTVPSEGDARLYLANTGDAVLEVTTVEIIGDGFTLRAPLTHPHYLTAESSGYPVFVSVVDPLSSAAASLRVTTNDPQQPVIEIGLNYDPDENAVEIVEGTTEPDELSAILTAARSLQIFADEGSDIVDVVATGSGRKLTVDLADGDDSLSVSFNGESFPFDIDGSTGNDELILAGSSLVMDLSNLGGSRLANLESLGLTENGPMSLILSAGGVQQVTDDRNTLIVRSDAEDVVQIQGTWEYLPAGFHGGSFVHRFGEDGITLELINERPWTNPVDSFEVNRDGRVSALDALTIINRLNEEAPSALTDPISADDVSNYYDVNGDLRVTALDALNIINELNRNAGIHGAAEHNFASSAQLPWNVTEGERDDWKKQRDTFFAQWTSQLF